MIFFVIFRKYRTQVNRMRKESLYQSPGAHTFFIPVDEGFKVCRNSDFNIELF